MKKNLAILIYSLASGGAERVVSILLNELKDKFNITLVLMNETIFYEIPKDIKILYLENSKPFENGIFKLLKLPFLAWKYKNICKQNSIDISLSFMNRPNYINTISKVLKNRVKALISERIAPSQEYKTDGIKDKISRFLIENLYNRANIIIPNAKGIELDLIKNFSIDKSKIEVINNPIDLKKIDSLKDEVIDFDFSKFTFVMVGRLQAQKNHSLLINAFSNIKNKNTQLLIIGDGELREKLEVQIKELNLSDRVFLLGRQENPYKYLSKSDSFVFSSNYEGFPNVLLESLACGLATISTDCISGPREILSPNSDTSYQLKDGIEEVEYGVLTTVNSSSALTKAMELILNNQALRDNYKIKAKIRANEFKKDKIIQKFITTIIK